jgi:hypothetical protein
VADRGEEAEGEQGEVLEEILKVTEGCMLTKPIYRKSMEDVYRA